MNYQSHTLVLNLKTNADLKVLMKKAGLSYKELAQLLNIPLANMYNRLRARNINNGLRLATDQLDTLNNYLYDNNIAAD